MKQSREKFTLGLELATDPRWVNIAEKNIRDILVDHAYCEQKAASSCISLIVQYPDKEKLVEILTPVVAEEWDHFSRVLDQLRLRGFGLGPPRRDEYVVALAKLVRKGGTRDQDLAEKLLMNAMIEARSCERFKILWKNIPDEGLRDFYYELMVSEAGHYRNFLQLAKLYVSPEYVNVRWKEFLHQEAELVGTLAPRGDRMH